MAIFCNFLVVPAIGFAGGCQTSHLTPLSRLSAAISRLSPARSSEQIRTARGTLKTEPMRFVRKERVDKPHGFVVYGSGDFPSFRRLQALTMRQNSIVPDEKAEHYSTRCGRRWSDHRTIRETLKAQIVVEEQPCIDHTG